MSHSSSPIPFRAQVVRFPTIVLLFASLALGVQAKEKEETVEPVNIESLEAVTRLQVFLDRAEFAPGKIDGRMGQFTVEALALYREAQGVTDIPAPAAKVKGEKEDELPDLADLDMTALDPLFLSYEVTKDDLEQVGELPEKISDQAKLKSLSYGSAAETIAEKFHMDQGYLEELNPGKTKNIKAGDMLKVVNVVPFDKQAVEALKPVEKEKEKNKDKGKDKDKAKDEAKDEVKDKTPPKEADKAAAISKEATDSDATEEEQDKLQVNINTKTNMLTVHANDKLVAAYPVTVGSEQTESPEGEWKVTKITTMPNFRYDKSMLKTGVRSDDFHMLPPGPNNPVGVMWIQLNKDGIGIHGTNDPATIGRASSHGCVRLANWDVVRFAKKISVDVPVTIEADSE